MYLAVAASKQPGAWRARFRTAPPSDIRFSRVADSPRMRKWLQGRPDVQSVWGPYTILNLPFRPEDCLDEHLLFSK